MNKSEKSDKDGAIEYLNLVHLIINPKGKLTKTINLRYFVRVTISADPNIFSADITTYRRVSANPNMSEISLAEEKEIENGFKDLITEDFDGDNLKFKHIFILTSKAASTQYSEEIRDELFNQFKNSEMSSEQFFDCLVFTFSEKFFQNRLIEVINFWYTSFPSDFKSHSMRVKHFKFYSYLEQKKIDFSEKFFEVSLKQKKRNSKIFWFVFSPVLIAENLTVSDCKNLLQLNRKSLNDPNSNRWSTFHSFLKSNKYFESIVVSSLFFHKKFEMRVSVLELIIRSCMELKKIRNYNSLFMLISALKNPLVSNLKKEWSSLDYDVLKSWEILSPLVEKDNEWENLRNEITLSLDPNDGLVPFFDLLSPRKDVDQNENIRKFFEYQKFSLKYHLNRHETLSRMFENLSDNFEFLSENQIQQKIENFQPN